MRLNIPLTIERGRLKRTSSDKQSIDQHLDMLLTTQVGGNPSDQEMGFIFNNLKFEIFDEKEGVVLDSTEHDTTDVYNKKISGSSRNVNTFAVDLRQLIERYETRLRDVAVTMSYIREHKKIYIVVKGTLAETGSEYKYQNTLDIWA